MVNIFMPGFFLLGGLGLLVGAGIGEFLANKFPHQRFIIAMCFYAALAVAILAGADFNQMMSGMMADGRNPQGSLIWYVGRQIFMLGLFSGAALFCQQRRRSAQVIALGVSGVIGLPIMMNIWMGAGISYAKSGMGV
ncbi:hypothetical protein WNY37_06835 [Henriciella sp. AS95]|uniref:hypothetical protein n=1 Tax=Henriciella sp. AS95 TaxID=3135782 RepID=UPI003182427C